MITNGSSRPLNVDSGTMPDVSDALLDWFQAMTFIIITKTIVNFKTVESKSEVSFQGVIQPLSPQRVMMKPEGQRTWKWWQLHSDTTINLSPDDQVEYLDQTYRVMGKRDHSLSGFYEYELVQDYEESA